MIFRFAAAFLTLCCASGGPGGSDSPVPEERELAGRCEWRPMVTVHVDNRSSFDIAVSFGAYTPSRTVKGFTRTTYNVARTHLQSNIRLRIDAGGLQLGPPPPVPTEYVECNEATLIIGPRPRYSFFHSGAPVGDYRRDSAPEALRQSTGSPITVDTLGVMRWAESGEEVALFGVNYSTPFAHAYRAHGYLGVDRKQSIDADVLHLTRLGLDAYRIHVWDREISDREGNLVANDHLDLFDYLLGRLATHEIKVILTPIAWWPAGYPEPDPGTNGFSDGYDKGEMTVNADARRVQANYLEQFVTHRNPYTGTTYAADPNVLAIEIFNEPSHPGSPDETTAYIDAMVTALRDAGFGKPIFYNISQNYWDGHGHAVCAARIQGVSHQWYPTGLVRNGTVGGNMLPNVDEYTIPYADFPECRDKARMVYEFDAADVAGTYMYPAMARSFREAGFQWATQFAYDPMVMAHANTEYQTHFLNLVYTPGKAISFMIAGEVFRQTRRGAVFGQYPDTERFGPFRVSYAENLSEMVTDTSFFHSNHTRTDPQSPASLRHVAGVGTSPVVTYQGNGAYFLDRVEDGVWRLELYPDAIPVTDPFTRPSLEREAVRVIWRTRPMQINLPNLGADFAVESVTDTGVSTRAQSGMFDVSPGAYLLTRAGTTRPIWRPDDIVGGRWLGAFVTPPPSEAPTTVVHTPASDLTAQQPFTVRVEVVSTSQVDSAALFVRNVGGWGRTLRLTMAPMEAFGYSTEVPAERAREGLVEYAVTVYERGEARTFPSDEPGHPYQWDFTGRDFWQVRVVPADAPLILFDGRRDLEHVLYPHPWDYVRFQTSIVTGSEPDRLALAATVENFEPAPHHFALRTFLPEGQRTRLASISSQSVIRIRARATGRATDRMEVSLVERDGTAWGTVIELTDSWQDIAIPLESLRLARLALLPRPYPQFLPYLREPRTTRTRPRLEELDGLQFAVGADMFAEPERANAHGFQIERVLLDTRR